MRQLRVHVTLVDQPPSDKQQTVAFLEFSTLVEDEVDVAAYGRKLSARIYVEEEAGTNDPPARYTVDLVPPESA